MYKKITRFIDFIFIILIVYVISFVWIRYYVKDLTSTIFLSMTATIVIYLLIKAITFNSSEKKTYNTSVQKQIDTHLTALIFMSHTEQKEFLKRLYENFYCALRLGDVSVNNILDAAKWAIENDLSYVNVIMATCPMQIKEYASSISGIKINIIDKYKLFEDMKNLDYYPKAKIKIEKNKVSTKALIAHAFSKKRAKGYILTGFLLIATSFLIPYKIYYITVGSILLLIALICLTFNHKT